MFSILGAIGLKPTRNHLLLKMRKSCSFYEVDLSSYVIYRFMRNAPWSWWNSDLAFNFQIRAKYHVETQTDLTKQGYVTFLVVWVKT